MANTSTVTVDKSYFDALLRRADFHTSASLDPASVTISKVEYNSLLRIAREYDLLKTSLFKGGLTPEALTVLIAGAKGPNQHKDSPNDWAEDFVDQPPSYGHGMYSTGHSSTLHTDTAWNQGAAPPYNFGRTQNSQVDRQNSNRQHRVSPPQRHTSYGDVPPSVPEYSAFEEDADSLADDEIHGLAVPNGNTTMRTLYICGFTGQTTLSDLLSAMKGGKILSANLRSERSATVTFLDAAADFLSWSKRNDVYINHKRVDVRWADKQFHLNTHIANKIANGATRNILIRNAGDKGLTANHIRDDMEHIHGLVVINVTFRNGNAYVSTNSVHNALFARTCMMSRKSYKGCKIEFYADDCDVPLPIRAQAPRAAPREVRKKEASLGNRFDMLYLNDSSDHSSDEENRDPHDEQIGDSDVDDDDDDDDDNETISIKCRHGVRLDHLDSESVI